MDNFNKLYRPLADDWRLYDNSRSHSPRLIAAGRGQRTIAVEDHEVWSRIKEASQ